MSAELARRCPGAARRHGGGTGGTLIWIEGEDVAVSTNLRYGPDQPVDVVVRKRGWRFDVSDAGRAVELAGRPRAWPDVAGRVVEAFAIDVDRRGVGFVQSNEQRLESLITRVAECSVAVYQELLDHE